jgi:hypothetical protein
LAAMVPRIPAFAIALGGAACGASTPALAPVCASQLQSRGLAHAQCGATLDLTPINSYAGELAEAQVREEAVLLINGNCTGTVIAAAAGPVVLTAGHCVALGDRALLAFNVEDQPDGVQLVTDGTVIEQAAMPDYALISLDRLPAAQPTPLTRTATDRLAIIQHPRGGPKTIAEGVYVGECTGIVSYSDLDTLVGSSGAGVLTERGFLLGIHTDGDCSIRGGGLNFGWTAAEIVAVSAYLVDADIADR